MYELIVIARTDDAEGKVEKHLKDVSATDVKAEKMGKRQLAYPVAKVTEAEYLAWTFDAPGDGINQLNSKLRLEQEAILRYLLTKAPKVSRVPEVSRVSGAEEVAREEEKAKPKVTVTTKIKASKKEETDVESAGKTRVSKVKESLFSIDRKASVSRVSKAKKAKR